MEIKKLTGLRDIYPTGIDNVNDAYSIPDPPLISLNQAYTFPTETVMKLRGKYPQNVINFDLSSKNYITPSSINDVKVATITEADGLPLTFQFIVNFPNPDGTPDFWTSPTFKDKIMMAQMDGNPYYRLDNLPVVVLSFETLRDYSQNLEFVAKEGYAGVKIEDTIREKEDMLLHINWMVSSDENLRPVLGNSKYYPLGAWSIIPDDTLGAQWADFLTELETAGAFDTSIVNDTADSRAQDTGNPIINDIINQLNLQNGLITPQGNDTGTGFNIITPISTNPLDPLNLNGTQTNDVNYNIFNAFTDTNLTVPNADGSFSVYNSSGNIIANSGTAAPNPFTITPGPNTTGNTGIGGGVIVTVGNNPTNIGGTGASNLWNVGNTNIGNGGVQPFGGPISIGTYGTSGIAMGTYYPFTTAGKYVGEIRGLGGKTYTWNGTKWIGS